MMRKSVSKVTDFTKGTVKEFIKNKPMATNVQGIVTVSVHDTEGNALQEIITENSVSDYMKDTAYTYMFNDVLLENQALHVLSQNPGMQMLLCSEMVDENPKNPFFNRLDGNIIGFANKVENYSGSDTKKGSYNSVESFVRVEDGRIRYHRVYDFPTHSSNGTFQSIVWSGVSGANEVKKIRDTSPLITFKSDIIVLDDNNTVEIGGKDGSKIYVAKLNHLGLISDSVRVDDGVTYCTMGNYDSNKCYGHGLQAGASGGGKIYVNEINEDGVVLRKISSTTTTKNLQLNPINFPNHSDYPNQFLSMYSYLDDSGTHITLVHKNSLYILIKEGTNKAYVHLVKIPLNELATTTSVDCYRLDEVSSINVPGNAPDNKGDVAYTFRVEDGELIVYAQNSRKNVHIKYVIDDYTLGVKSVEQNSNMAKTLLSMVANRLYLADTKYYLAHGGTYVGLYLNDSSQSLCGAKTNLPNPVTKTAVNTMKVQYDFYFEFPPLFENVVKEF